MLQKDKVKPQQDAQATRLRERLNKLIPNILTTKSEMGSTIRSIYVDQPPNETPLISHHTFSPESVLRQSAKSIEVIAPSSIPYVNKAYSVNSHPLSLTKTLPIPTPSLTQGFLQSLDNLVGRPKSRDVNSSQRSFLLQGSDRLKQPRPERYVRLLTKFLHENWYIIRIFLIAIGVIIGVLIFPPLIAGIFA